MPTRRWTEVASIHSIDATRNFETAIPCRIELIAPNGRLKFREYRGPDTTFARDLKVIAESFFPDNRSKALRMSVSGATFNALKLD